MKLHQLPIRAITCVFLVIAASPAWSGSIDNIHLTVNPGSNAYYLSLSVDNSNEDVVGLEISDGVNYLDWLPGVESFSGWDFASTGLPFTGPISVRLEGISGEYLTAVDILATTDGGFTYDTGLNFSTTSTVPGPLSVFVLAAGLLGLVARASFGPRT